MGVFIQVFLPVASLRGVSVYPPTANLDPTATPVIPTSQNALENAVSTHSNGILSVPAFLEEWVLSPEAVNQLSKFLYVVCTSPSALHKAYVHACRYYQAFAGGPLAKKTGDSLVASGVRLKSVYGSTECGPFAYIASTPEDANQWEWIRFSPNSKIRWVPLGDGTSEMQVLVSEWLHCARMAFQSLIHCIDF